MAKSQRKTGSGRQDSNAGQLLGLVLRGGNLYQHRNAANDRENSPSSIANELGLAVNLYKAVNGGRAHPVNR